MIQNDAHGNPPLGSEDSANNRSFLILLYGLVQLNGGGPCMSHTGSVHILGSLIAPCTLGVRLGTTLMAIHHSPLYTRLSTEFSYTCCTNLYS